MFAFMAFLGVFAQEEMPTVWEMKAPFKVMFNGTGTEERGYSYIASDKEIALFANETGRIKWTNTFKALAPTLSKIDEALGRLEEGAYGNCFECGSQISEQRLRALPFAVRCKDCEEARETAARRERLMAQRHSSSFFFDMSS